MSRKNVGNSVKLCALCRIPYVARNSRATFCGDRCRQRWHRGHRSCDTIRRRAAGWFNGQLSDRDEADFQS